MIDRNNGQAVGVERGAVSGPLSGLRVVELTWVAMGPYAGHLLASLGAEVIQVGQLEPESVSAAPRWYDELNIGKTCIGIDVKSDEGLDLMKQLLIRADVFIENFRPGVVERLGLSYEELSPTNPGLIMISTAAVGRKRTDGNYAGYAPIFSALAGLAHLTGDSDAPPTEIRHPADLTGGAVAVLGILAGVARRRKVGRGCYIDLSAREAVLWTLTAHFLGVQAGMETDSRRGNGHRWMAPHGVYRCKGENCWISIAIGSDGEWEKLCAVMSQPDLRSNARYAKSADRHLHRDELDRIIEMWTQDCESNELTVKLQAAGVAAFPSSTNRDLWNSQHLQGRGIFERVDGRNRQRWIARAPWVFTGSTRRHPPTVLGMDAVTYVFGDLMGLPSDQIEALRVKRVIGPRGLGL